MILPPPNVTGSLHLGHALNITIQDVIARFYKAKGMHVNWIPGTDHAGIATQLIAIRELNALGKQLEGAELVNFIYSVKEKHEQNIINQLKQMNTLLNWEEYAFTLDQKRCEHVEEAFVTLFNKGLIFKDKRFVYWDCGLQTACSDLEVDFKTIKGKFYYINYEIEGGLSAIVATTRPETIFADCALAVNPNDQTNKHLIGKTALVPIINKRIPIIADDSVDVDKGSGVLKITPCHDLLDAEIAQRHNLENWVSVIDKKGLMINVPEHLLGISVSKAKEMVEQALGKQLVKIEIIEHNVPVGEKSQNVLELMQTEQWFIDMKEMAARALKVVDSGDPANIHSVKFIPKELINTYKYWLDNIQPWCISRQIVWGHRIPVWYDEQGLPTCDKKIAQQQNYKQDTDVLDTWFSSGLWAYSAQNEEAILPTSFLVTGKDILFFWVARMIMLTLELKDKIPFEKVFLHGLVLDKHGKKMSKVVGNVIDPLQLIEQFGSDVLKIALLSKMQTGKDIRFNPKQLELTRNFFTKIAHAVKFATQFPQIKEGVCDSWCDWIMHETKQTQKEVNFLMENWEFAKVLLCIEAFVRDKVCSWFIEAAKMLSNQAFVSVCLKDTLQITLEMLAPFAPIFTQEQSELLNQIDACALPEIEKDFRSVLEQQKIITQARALSKLTKKISFAVEQNGEFFARITRLNFVNIDRGASHNFHQLNQLYIHIQDQATIQDIIDKLNKEIIDHQGLIDSAQHRLSNKEFINKVNDELIEQMHDRIEENQAQMKEKSELVLNLKQLF